MPQDPLKLRIPGVIERQNRTMGQLADLRMGGSRYDLFSKTSWSYAALRIGSRDSLPSLRDPTRGADPPRGSF